MYYLIYVSSTAKLMNDNELLELLNTCKKNNKTLDITGMLLYQGGNFMQMLEGDRENVLSLYKKIADDPRHNFIIKVMDGEIDSRCFSDWSMGFFNMDKYQDLGSLENYIDEKVEITSFCKNTNEAFDFIKIFNKSHQ